MASYVIFIGLTPVSSSYEWGETGETRERERVMVIGRSEIVVSSTQLMGHP